MREISEGNVGSEAQFFARANEGEFRLDLRFLVGLCGHLWCPARGGRKTPSPAPWKSVISVAVKLICLNTKTLPGLGRQ